MLNRIVDSDTQAPLNSLMSDFGKQRRFDSVWISMVCFLLYCNQEAGTLEEMGLELSEKLDDDLLDIEQALMNEGYPEPGDAGQEGMVETSVYKFIANLLTDTSADPTTNPLLWWTIVLVRSSIETGPDDFISRGRFLSNILPMDLDIQQRLEGIVHFAKVLLLDVAFTTWHPTSESQFLEVQTDLDTVDNSWMGTYSSTRLTQPDERTCFTPAWRSALDHIEKMFKEFMVQPSETPMSQIIAIRKQLTDKS
jgi:hypothetical protein